MQLYSSQANAQLHLGYLIQQTGNARGAYLGSGFDLKTDTYGALRAGSGLYVSTHPKQAGSQPLDVSESHQQLVGAQGVAESLSAASEQHNAETLKPGYDALQKFAEATQSSVAGSAAGGGHTAGGGTGHANAFKDPVMLMGSPAGIALSTQQSAHIAADQQINLVSAQSTHIASGKSLIASVADKLSLFVQNAGMKLFAAKGKVEIQAQDDNVEMTAQKTLKVISATESIEGVAKQEVLLTAGGAYIRIKDGNIEIHAPGKVDVKGAQHEFSGPTSLSKTYNMEGKKADMRIRYVDAEGNVPEGEPIKFTTGDGTVHSVALDGEGKAELKNIDFGQLLANQVKRFEG